MAKVISIKSGIVTAFDGDQTVPGIEFTQISKTRVSRIVPAAPILKIAFIFLRALNSDRSAISQWTRKWHCNWVVVIDGIEQACFWDRASAINFEKALICQMGRFN